MDRTAIEELFAYTGETWNAYEEVIRPLGPETLARPVRGSGWPALRNALAHINLAYERWLADPDRTSPMTGIDPETILSWDDVDAHRREVRALFRSRIDSLLNVQLVAPHEMNIDGQVLSYSPGVIFALVLLHEHEHHGDLNTLLYQLGVEPPQTSYRFYAAESRR